MNKVVLDLATKGHKYYHLEARGSEYYISIISRYPISKTTSNLVFKTTPPNSDHIYLIPVHLCDTPFTFYTIRGIPYDKTPDSVSSPTEAVELSYSTKAKYIDRILKYISRHPDRKYIIAGDFNEPSHLDDTQYEWMISKKFEEAGIIDSYRYTQNRKKIKPILDNHGYNTDGATCCHGKPPLCRVDYIYTKNLDIVDSKVMKTYENLSDHLPVITDVTIVLEHE